MQEKVSSREAERLGLMPYRANIQQEIRFILSAPLLFFLVLPRAAKAALSSPPAALSAFWRTAKKNSTIAKMREKVQLPSPAMFAV